MNANPIGPNPQPHRGENPPRRRIRRTGFLLLLLGWAAGATLDARGETPGESAALPTPPVGARPGLCLLAGALESEDADAVQLSNLLFALFEDRLAETGLDLVALPEGSEIAPAAIAREAGCGYLLRIDFSHRRGGNGIWRQVVRDTLGAAAGYVPVGGGLGGALLGSMATRGALAAADYVLATRAKDKLQLSCRLFAVEATTPLVDRSEAAKAKRDGEDVLTPLVARAAAEVAAGLATAEGSS